MDSSRVIHHIHTPTRRQAPPRSSPSSSPTTEKSFYCYEIIENAEGGPSPHSSGAQFPVRGRTLHRNPSQSRLVSRAATRRHTKRIPTHLKWENFLGFDEFAHVLADSDHPLLEPLPDDRFEARMSEEIHCATTFDSSVDVTKFAGHRDTFAVLDLRQLRHRGSNLPAIIFTRTAPYPDFDTYKSVRLTCHSWSMAVTKAYPLLIANSMLLPTEILEKIYVELSPLDFNAARHTCRAWMLASLNENMLLYMLNRGGWLRAATADREVVAEQDPEHMSITISDDWLLGKRLATECSLGLVWTGNGVRSMQTTTSGLRLTSFVDFRQLGSEALPLNDGRPRDPIHFVISTCGEFLLAFQSCVIYIYALQGSNGNGSVQPYGGQLELWSTVLCPAPVLAVSMDSSSERYAVAALLQGAVGIVCESRQINDPPSQVSLQYTGSQESFKGSIWSTDPSLPYFDDHFTKSPSTCTLATTVVIAEFGDQRQIRTMVEPTVPICQDLLRRSTTSLENLISQPFKNGRTVSHVSGTSTSHPGHGIWTVYHDLCTADDPPRSVALCSDRRYVAFGCRKGVELHWVDALTGQDLTRWFPHPAQCDFLYFMPSESTKKLKLVASSVYSTARRDAQEVSSSSSIPSGRLDPFHRLSNARDDGQPPAEVLPGYCGAVPLSDGHHLLFMVPNSKELYVGQELCTYSGDTKIGKSFVFLGPRDAQGILMAPHRYTAASELRWGLRVGVVYSDQLWLFTVPPDLLTEQSTCGKIVDISTGDVVEATMPIPIAGVKVSGIQGLDSLALDAACGDLTLWAFTQDAKAYVFQLAGSSSKAVTQRAALQDGTVVLVQDADGDTVMGDAPYLSQVVDTCHVGRTLEPSDKVPSLVPCFPRCIHRYCKLLLNTTTGTQVMRPNHLSFFSSNISRMNINASASRNTTITRTERLSDGCFSLQHEDEGYWSAGDDEDFEAAGGHSTIYVSPITYPWSERSSARWTPICRRETDMAVDEDEGIDMDLLEMCRCECEILGG